MDGVSVYLWLYKLICLHICWLQKLKHMKLGYRNPCQFGCKTDIWELMEDLAFKKLRYDKTLAKKKRISGNIFYSSLVISLSFDSLVMHVHYFLYRLLLHADLASNWLACFPLSARIHVYDVFFVNGLATEVVQTLVPCLQQNASDGHDVNYVHSNTERYGVNICLYAQLLNGGLFSPLKFHCFCRHLCVAQSCT